jgi:hypothetical protein
VYGISRAGAALQMEIVKAIIALVVYLLYLLIGC